MLMRKPSKLAEPRLSLRGGGGKLQGVSGLHAKVCSPTEAKRERGERQFHGIVHGAAITVILDTRTQLPLLFPRRRRELAKKGSRKNFRTKEERRVLAFS